MAAKQDDAVKTYLTAIKEPNKLIDPKAAEKLEGELADTEDPISRLQLRQQILDTQQVNPATYEDEFVAVAKGWADEHGIGYRAFQAEGVPDSVLRRAGFSIPRRGQRRAARPATDGARSRVNAEDVRKAIPHGKFTIKQVQEASGASAAVVRRVVQEEVEAGSVHKVGSDPGHQGPGRAPALYERA